MKDIVKEFGERVTLVQRGGVATNDIEMVFQGEENSFLTFDLGPSYEEGDEIRRKLPGDREQVFIIENVQFRQGVRDAIPKSYTLHVRKKGQMPKGTGGNYSISVSGEGARVNLNSTDNSTTVIDRSTSSAVFADIREKAKLEIDDNATVQRITDAVNKMESASDNKSLQRYYNEFLAAAANHMTVFLPLMPTLSALLHHA